MLSRIMRHPAGLVKKALGVRFKSDLPRPEGVTATPPDYWLSRYASPGFALLPPLVLAPGRSHVGLVHGLHPERAVLSAQGGKAASFLFSERTPAPHP